MLKKWRKRTDERHSPTSTGCSITTGSTSEAATRGLLVGYVDPSVTIVDNVAGILGGIKLWELPER